MCRDRLKNEIEYERKGIRLEAMTILLVLVFASVLLSLYNSKQHSYSSATLSHLTDEFSVAVKQTKEILGKIKESADRGPDALVGAVDKIQEGIITLQSTVDNLTELVRESNRKL